MSLATCTVCVACNKTIALNLWPHEIFSTSGDNSWYSMEIDQLVVRIAMLASLACEKHLASSRNYKLM